jgi:hypothetical protein
MKEERKECWRKLEAEKIKLRYYQREMKLNNVSEIISKLTTIQIKNSKMTLLILKKSNLHNYLTSIVSDL